MISWVIFVGYVVATVTISVCKPEIIAHNSFIDKFVGGDLLNILGIVMTITFASIANIHLTVTRVIAAAFKDDVALGQWKAADLRSQLNSNAWLMFAAFLWAVAFSLLKGVTKPSDTYLALMDSAAFGALIVHVLVFRDIYSALFGLSASDLAVRGEAAEQASNT